MNLQIHKVFLEEEEALAMKPVGCFNGRMASYMAKDKGKFDFSCHDPFKETALHPICTLVYGFESSTDSFEITFLRTFKSIRLETA